MVRVGVHISIAGSIRRSVERAQEMGCDTFQIFSGNPRGWTMKALVEEDVAGFRMDLSRSGISPVVDHMPYLPNLAGGKPDLYERSIHALIAELGRCSLLGIPYLVTHLGHHLGDGIEIGRTRVADAIRKAMDSSESEVTLLLENTAGEKNGVGNTFEDIRAVMDGIDMPGRIGVCFDTCHAFGAGYDLRTEETIDETLHLFDEVIGLGQIKLVHLNDSRGDLGSGLDRHEHIGLGYIGEPGFTRILSRRVFRTLPLICETPVDTRRDDAGNIRMVRKLARG